MLPIGKIGAGVFAGFMLAAGVQAPPSWVDKQIIATHETYQLKPGGGVELAFGVSFGFNRHRHVGTITPGPLAPTYDTRFGTATDANGWITFGLNTGNRRVWVDSVNGNDTNNGLSAATAKATLVAAGAVLKGAGSAVGDQIMVAGGQGQTYTYVGQNDSVFNHIPGISATYPTAMLCYDSTDPTNAAKYGKLYGSNKPKITTDAGSAAGAYSFWDVASDQSHQGNYAVQGIDIVGSTNAAGFHPDGLQITYAGYHPNICYQNCRFDGVGISYNCIPAGESGATTTSATVASVGLISKCSFWGMWDADRGDHQAIFSNGWDQLKIQDCVGAHCGYRLGASRDDNTSDGGANIYGHTLYLHARPDVTVYVDRCFGIDSEMDDWGLRTSGAITQFVSIDQASPQALTGYSSVYTENPNGSVSTSTDFLCTGGQNTNTGHVTNGGGVGTANTATSGCSITNGYLFDNPLKAGSQLVQVNAAQVGQVAQFVAVSNLRVWNYATSRSLDLYPVGGGNGASATLSNCLLDSLVSNINNTPTTPLGGTNRLWTAGDYPAPITKAQLITALGGTSKADLVNKILAFPHLPWAQAALGLAQTAFGGTLTYQTAAVPSLTGLPAPEIVYKTTLSDLTMSGSFVRGPFPAITAMTVSGLICTVTTASAHGMSSGMMVVITGATPTAYNTGATPITVLNSTQFTYQKRSPPGGAATVMGSYTQAAALLGAGGNSTFASAGASGTGASDLPAGITLAGSTLAYDGSGSGSFPTFHITETNTDGAGMHTTAFFPSAGATLSAPTDSVTGSTTATIGVTTDTGSGTLYWVVSTSSTTPTAAQIEAGHDSTGSAGAAAGSQAVSTTGAQSVSVTGLTASTTYYAYFVQHTTVDSNVVGTTSFTTSGASWTPASLGANLAVDFTQLSTSNMWQDTAGTTPVTADGQTVKRYVDPTTGIIFTNSTGWVYHANSGHPYLAPDGTSKFTSTTNVTMRDASAQYSYWYTVEPASTSSQIALGANPSPTTLANFEAMVDTQVYSSTPSNLGQDQSGGMITVGTPFVGSGVVSVSGGTITAESFLNNVSNGSSNFTATPYNTNSKLVIGPFTAGAKFYGTVWENTAADSTTRSNAQTYMAGLHP